MSVSDPKSSFSLDKLYKYEPWTKDHVFYDGRTAKEQGTARLLDWNRGRGGKTSNPPHTQAGVPNWRNPSNYARKVLRLEHSKGSWTFKDNVVSTNCEGFAYECTETDIQLVLPDIGCDRSPDANILSRVRVEAMLKLADGKASIGANLAEAVAGVDNLAKGAINLFQILREIKHGNGSALHRRLRDTRTASSYLQLHFGLLPLMGDIKGSYEALHSKLQKAMVLHGKKAITSNGSKPVYTPRHIWKDFQDQSTSRTACTISASVETADLVNQTRVGLTDPLGIAWELVPWSFLIDWSIPVGNCLEALNARRGLQFVGGSESFRCEGKFVGTTIDPSGWTTKTPQTVKGQYVSYVRNKLNTWPIIRPYTKSPFSTSHAVTALALWRQLRK